MLELMSEGTRAHLLAFLSKKKVAFLVLLYERMIPELRSFCLAESRDFSIFQRTREDFWRFLADDNSSISWPQLTQDILDATPSSEDFGTLEGSFRVECRPACGRNCCVYRGWRRSTHRRRNTIRVRLDRF